MGWGGGLADRLASMRHIPRPLLLTALGLLLAGLTLSFTACPGETPSDETTPTTGEASGEAPVGIPADAPDYLDYSGRDDLLAGGVQLIPVETPKGTFPTSCGCQRGSGRTRSIAASRT